MSRLDLRYVLAIYLDTGLQLIDQRAHVGSVGPDIGQARGFFFTKWDNTAGAKIADQGVSLWVEEYIVLAQV